MGGIRSLKAARRTTGDDHCWVGQGTALFEGWAESGNIASGFPHKATDYLVHYLLGWRVLTLKFRPSTNICHTSLIDCTRQAGDMEMTELCFFACDDSRHDRRGW